MWWIGTPTGWWPSHVISQPFVDERLDWIEDNIQGKYSIESLPPFTKVNISFENEADIMYYKLRWK